MEGKYREGQYGEYPEYEPMRTEESTMAYGEYHDGEYRVGWGNFNLGVFFSV